MTNETTVSARVLREFACRVLTALGSPEDKARLVAESLVAANLRGVDTHGVHLLPAYVAQLRAGNIDPAAEGRILAETGACLRYDGERGFGQVVSDACCRHAVRLAREHGLGLAVACRSNHFGAAAFWAQRISSCGMIGIVLTNASPSVPPWQAREARIGTNPLCVAVPSSGGGSWLLDMATTAATKNKIVKAAANREPSIPAGWALDGDGLPTTDTREALRGLLMPLGGYKGSGLGLMVEILCGVLGGGTMGADVGGLYHLDRPVDTSQFFLAIELSRFLAPENFQARMEELVASIKSARPASGYDEVLVAGDPERRFEAERSSTGIPIDAGTWERLEAVAGELGIPMICGDRQV